MSKRGEWERFKEYCEPWLSEIKLLDVTLNIHANNLGVFYAEPGSRVPKELAWAGDGIQIWVQLLWHLYRQSEANTIVLDEPEVYLHPDLQRRLVRLLDSLPAQIILASHSGDVIAEAPRDGILWVDRRGVGGRRAKSAQTFSALSASLGSSYDLALVRSLRTKLVLACDCNDVRIVRALARTIGATRLANEQVVNVLQFRSTQSDQLFGSALREVLPSHIPALLLLQPGYRPAPVNEEIRRRLWADQIEVRLWKAVEIENYLLNADVIARVSGAAPEIIRLRIQDACFVLLDSTRSDFISARIRHSGDLQVSDAVASATLEFDSMWSDPLMRLRLVRGTRIMELLNEWFQRDGYRTVDAYALAKAGRPNELPDEVVECLSAIEEMVAS